VQARGTEYESNKIPRNGVLIFETIRMEYEGNKASRNRTRTLKTIKTCYYGKKEKRKKKKVQTSANIEIYRVI